MKHPQWENVGSIDSDRAAFKSTRLQAVVMDKVTGELLEKTVFSPSASRLGQYQWPKDFAAHINKHLTLARAGESGADGIVPVESGYKNALWAAPGVRVFAAHLRPSLWEKIGEIVGAKDLEPDSVITVTVSSKETGEVYETLSIRPGEEEREGWVWPERVAHHINTTSLFIGAGKLKAADESNTYSGASFFPQTARRGNLLWAPPGSGLAATLHVHKWTQAGQIRSDRGTPSGRRLAAVVIDSCTDEILESTTFITPEANRSYAGWPKHFADHINKHLKLVRAGQFDSKTQGTVWSSYANKLWTAVPGIRVFTTALHPDAWETVDVLPGGKLGLQSVVTVQVCSALTGKIRETLNFTPTKDRLEAAQWGQDLARQINAKSLYLRAGRAWEKDEIAAATLQSASNSSDICYPSQKANPLWVPKDSGLTVKVQVSKWQKTAYGIDSDRAALDGRPLMAVVVDSHSEEILEKIVFTPNNDRLGHSQWPKDCADHINKHSRYVRVGEFDSAQGIQGLESTYRNYLWVSPGVRAFITGCWRAGYWESIGAIGGEALGVKAVVSVRIASRVTGQVYETLTFSPSKDRLAANQWSQDLARHINKTSRFVRAGREWTSSELNAEQIKKTGKELFYPTSTGSGCNIIWAPKGSQLSVEISGDFYQIATPAPAIPYQVEVDNFTGIYSCKVPLGTVVGNSGAGPAFDVVFDVSAKRAELNVSSIAIVYWVEGTATGRRISVRTSNGIFHSFEPKENQGSVYWLGDLRLIETRDGWSMEYKDGRREYLVSVRKFKIANLFDADRREETLCLPSRIENSSGVGLDISWEHSLIYEDISGRDLGSKRISSPLMGMIKSIKDDYGTVLLEGGFTKTSMSVRLFPGRADLESSSVIDFEDFDFEREYSDLLVAAKYGTFRSAVPKKVTVKYQDSKSESLDFKFIGGNLAEVRSSCSTAKLSCDKQGKVLKHTRSAPGVADCVMSYTYADRKTTCTCKTGELAATEEFHYDATVNRLSKHVTSHGNSQVSEIYTYTSNSGDETLRIQLETLHKDETGSRSDISSMTYDKHGNPVKREQDGFVTEWTYYRGDPVIKEKTISSTRLWKQTSGLALIVGWGHDYINPIGWLNNIFNDKGLTWSTDYEIEKYFAPRATKHGKTAFGLPMELNYPGDMGFFTRHVESERVYTMNGSTREELYWTFYGYSKLEHFKEDRPDLLVLNKTIVFQQPVTTDKKKMTSYAAAQQQTFTYHADRDNIPSYGSVGSVETVLFDKDGKEVPDSSHKESYFTENPHADQSTSITYNYVVNQHVTIAGLTAYTLKDVHTGNVRRESNSGMGQDTYHDYDAYGRLKTTKLLKSGRGDVLQTYTYGYYRQGDGSQIVVACDSGSSMRNLYDAAGRFRQHQILISKAAGWRTLQAYEYDELGRHTEAVEFDYAADGSFLSRSVNTITYDAWGKPSCTNVDGMKTHSQYSPIKQQLVEWVEDSNGKLNGNKSVSDYNGNGTLKSVTIQDAKGKQLSKQGVEYTRRTEVSKLTSSLKGDIGFEYDAYGRTTLVEQNGVKFRSTYPAHTTAAAAKSASMEWTQGTDPQKTFELGKQEVDRQGRVTAVERGTYKQTYSYASEAGRLGRPGAVEGAKALNRPLAESLELRDCTLSTHEGFTGRTLPDPLSTSSYYSLQGRVLRVIDAFGSQTNYHYTPQGRYCAQSSAQMSSQVVRNAQGRVQQERIIANACGQVITISYDYDTLGRETQRLVSAAGFDDLTLQRAYDDKGKLQHASTRQGSKTVIHDETYGYDTAGRLTKYNCSGSHKPTSYGVVPTEMTYEVDQAGGLSQSTWTVTKEAYGTSNVINTWTYGSHGIGAAPLTEMSVKRKGRSTGRVMTFSNDSSGRLENMKWVYEGTETSAHYKLAYGSSGRLHEIQDVKNGYTTAYTYDALGKLVGRMDANHTVDVLYQHDIPYALIRHTQASDKIQRLALLNRSSGCEVQRIDSGRAGVFSSVDYSLEIKDAHGSIIASYGLNDKTVNFHSYSPYGERKTSHDDISWRGFNGEMLDPEFEGIYHLGNGYRVYCPWMMRFISGDHESPFGVGGANPYTYCYGDPVNHMDPSGHQVIGRYTRSTQAYLSDPLVDAIVNGVIGVVLGAVGGFVSFGPLGAIVVGGINAAAAGLGIAALYAGKDNPDLATTMQLFAFAISFEGTFGSIAPSAGGRVARAGTRSFSALDLPGNPSGVRSNARHLGAGAHTLKSDAGADLFVLHTHPKNKYLYIDSHGTSINGWKFDSGEIPSTSFTTKVTPELALYADPGFTTPPPRNYTQMLDGKLAAKNFYRDKLPNAMLAEIKPKDFVEWYGPEGAHIPKQVAGYVKTGQSSVDYLTPLGPVTLEQVFKVLEREGYRYEMVTGTFCRGGVRHYWGTPRWRAALQKHHFAEERSYGVHAIRVD